MHYQFIFDFVLQINFFLYAITGKAFRHELKRLFISIAVKLHLSKDTIQKPGEYRTTAININYLAAENDFQHPMKRIQSSPVALQYLQCPQSIGFTVSNNNLLHRNFRPQQQQQQQTLSTRRSMNDVTYCFQRISNV